MSVHSEPLAGVQQRIRAAADACGRVPESVRLIAVSKHKSLASIKTLADSGQVDFGENRMQEALDKIDQCTVPGIQWHFIGHIQANKTRFVPGHFAWVHTIDSEKLAQRIARATGESDHKVRLLIQVNISADPAKYGIAASEVFSLADRIMQLEDTGVQLRGLMTIGRRGAEDADARQTFAGLRKLLEQCRERFGEQLSELSMGMSDDYELAIREGATMVRVGTALFGARD